MSTSSVKTCSERLAKNKVSHIFFTFESGKLKTFGDKSTVEAFENDKEMLSVIKKKLKDSSQLKKAEDEATTIESVSRTELFALPGSEKWKGAAKIREACICKSYAISVLGGTGHCATGGVKPRKDGHSFTPGVTMRKDLRI